MLKIAPSILSADFTRLGAEVEDCLAGGAEYIHFDVMDGIFVPNISIGIPVLKSLRKATDAFLDVHLMIDRPVRYAKAFCDAGADLVTLHVESDTPENIGKALDIVRECRRKTGLSVKPGTPAEALYPFLDKLDLILVMTVEPGFGGQSFMGGMLPKIRRLRDAIDSVGGGIELEVDGGIDDKTARLVKDAGADVLVAGSAVFSAADRAAAIAAIRNA
ncbi:MAG TPA: ribulose-phosphate 3-epimerase [Oscillospiraceae bacterium]|nr:ribulose-phosphate 3-epimerase [Oscillospiraceae bacterium]HPS76372.1 ribulose-phosphate 3-epimerase [Oscillospiraceae bacterium]